MQTALIVNDPLSKCTHHLSSSSATQMDGVDESRCSTSTSELNPQASNLGKEINSPHLGDKSGSYRYQLKQDVQILEHQLQEEIRLQAFLESAVEKHALKLSTPSSIPQHNDGKIQELLTNIASLEVTVSRLEVEVITLHCQVTQERNERKISEYHLRHASLQPLLLSNTEEVASDSAEIKETFMKREAESDFHPIEFEKLCNWLPVTGLWDHPNLLSEGMVWCMKIIFTNLSDSSPSKSSALKSQFSSPSPNEHPSNLLPGSVSEQSKFFSWIRSSQVDMQGHSGVLAADNSFDPYRARGKLRWADIGSYGLAVEVSWMSVSKRQLGFAEEALRRYRLLVEQLAKVNPTHLCWSEKLAFWINLYNALIMHAYLVYGVPKSDLKLLSLMQKAAYTVGGHSFSAAAIEFVMLKMKTPAHRPQIALLLALQKPKARRDEHKRFAMDECEPLAAFALSCGMHSSPAVRVYKGADVREQLQEAQRDFVRASVGVDSKGKVLVPKLLHCYVTNFVSDPEPLVWILRFLPPCQAAFVEQCVLLRRRRGLFRSRIVSVTPFDSRFRYIFLPDDWFCD